MNDNGVSIMIVDNDQVNSFVLKNIIMRNYADAKVDLLPDGSEALVYLKKLDQGMDAFPAVILLDIYMPVMDGFDFLDAYIKEFAHKESIIFAMSNSLIKEDQQRANDYNVVKGFITKPLIYNNIDFIIETYMQERGRV
jgi:CheY-like chemotaxis protein